MYNLANLRMSTLTWVYGYLVGRALCNLYRLCVVVRRTSQARRSSSQLVPIEIVLVKLTCPSDACPAHICGRSVPSLHVSFTKAACWLAHYSVLSSATHFKTLTLWHTKFKYEGGSGKQTKIWQQFLGKNWCISYLLHYMDIEIYIFS